MKAKGGQPNPTSAHSEQGQQETRGASAAASANSAAAKANPQLDFSDSGSIPVRMEVMPAQRMIDPPDLFNTKSREKPLPRWVRPDDQNTQSEPTTYIAMS